ncbi:unnamed protein product [Ilex paraguariensis]|uniref:Dirigent protein n=2 Tax=Ilex paraguariensis TaxID=185542 RepID=A0ABC8RE34_9AQUA
MEMRRLSLFLVLCSIVLAMPAVYGTAQGPKEVEEWFQIQKLRRVKEKVTKLHFYFHQKLNGENLTAATVAKANMTDTSPTFFGLVNVIDNPLTVKPRRSSNEIGRVKGLYAAASLEEVALSCVLNFVFTKGKYNGSSLSLLGNDPYRLPVREMPIVGGSGVFRLARGVAKFRTYFVGLGAPPQNVTVEVDIVALHY